LPLLACLASWFKLFAIPASTRNDCICSAVQRGATLAPKAACLIQVLARIPASLALPLIRNISAAPILIRNIWSRLALAFGLPPLCFGRVNIAFCNGFCDTVVILTSLNNPPILNKSFHYFLRPSGAKSKFAHMP
jgi:hypothetical protein